MKLGIMQPYFFPYPGHFDLINCSDRWIVFDTVQYIRHGWINRNRILHPNGGWQYITLPLKKHGLQTAICDVAINDDLPWREKILGQLTHYRRRARYYADAMTVVNEALAYTGSGIAQLNAHILKTVCAYLGLPFRCSFFSEMDLPIGNIVAPGDWALKISMALGASEYVNPPGGRDLFDVTAFQEAGIKLRIRDVPPMQYTCRGYEFQPGLSIIDAMMWNDAAAIRAYLADCRDDLAAGTPR